MRNLTMHQKIVLMTFFIISFSFLIAGIFVISNLLNEQEKDYNQRAMLIARTVSNMPDIVQQLEKGGPDAIKLINHTVEEVRVINMAEYIVVMDMNRIKYSHPASSELGKKSESGDLNPAFSEHYYISKAKGDIGIMIRAFVPILNEHKKQVGVVIVAYAMPTLYKIFSDNATEIIITILLSMLFSMWGASILAGHIKKRMFNLEPEEIAKLYVERQETFNAIQDGIIAVDNEMTITIFNAKAGSILGKYDDPNEYIGKKIYDVLPDTRLPEIVQMGQPIYNQELYINKHSILSNRIPIQVEGKIVGAVAIFKDLTEVRKLAEELTGVKAFVQALRVQTHEHKNKLHTIAGLLQLGNTSQALEYLKVTQENETSMTQFLQERFLHEHISGLLLSKISRGKELDIVVEIDEESSLTRFPPFLDHHDFVVLIGNLIENAFDALQQVERAEKHILLSIAEHDGLLAIMVSDNGIGMSEEVQQRIFENGFSTKKTDNHGIGLHLTAEIIKKGHGSIEVTSTPNIATSFIISFEMEGEQ